MPFILSRNLCDRLRLSERQRKCIEILFKSSCYNSVIELMKIHKIISIDELIAYSCYQYLSKIYHNVCPQYLTTYFVKSPLNRRLDILCIFSRARSIISRIPSGERRPPHAPPRFRWRCY